jgi:arylsulfatase A-like enzyme
MIWCDRRGHAATGRLGLLACAALLALAAGCRREPEGFELRREVEAGHYAVGAGGGGGRTAAPGLRFPSRPAVGDVEVDHERRPVVLTTVGGWSWTGRVPPRAELHAGLQLVPGSWPRVRQLRVVAELHAGRDREVLQVARWSDPANPVWLDLAADLGRYAGQRVTIELAADLAGLPPRLRGVNLIAWGPVTVLAPGGARDAGKVAQAGKVGEAGKAGEAGDAGTLGDVGHVGNAGDVGHVGGVGGPSRGSTPRPEGRQPGAGGTAPRPNILFILVDTLRRDRLTPYGYQRQTSPEIARRLAAAGTVMEDAYSQAAWTMPSVVSLFTGRHPGEMLGADRTSYGIPGDVQPLAERLAGAGYDTAGFLANPTLHVGAGFERGFRTFYAPPADVEWLRRHGDDLNRHVLPWLAARQREAPPFFLYVHYIDPHDPYDNPEIRDNRSPFEARPYTGPVAGDWVHGFFSGKLTMTDPVADLAHLSALYDSEVHYVDGRIGEILAALHLDVLARTLVVLTADHGEELLDHGGWKHGQTMYDEQIHVPLLWRWDGHIPAGRRLAGTVRLLDLAPTLAAAAGAPPDPGWEGEDLLPALTGAAPLRQRPAFAEGLSGGPLRAAIVLDRLKLMVFNRTEPFAPADDLQRHLWQVDLGRLAGVAAYDLAQDPAERHNLLAFAGLAVGAPTAPAATAAMATAAVSGPPPSAGRLPLLALLLARRLDPCLDGLRLAVGGLAAGSHLHVEVGLAQAPRRLVPFLLGNADRASLDGSRLTLDLVGGSLMARGVSLEGGFDARSPARQPAARPGAAAPRGTAARPALAIESLTATVDGQPLPPARLRLGASTPYTGGPIPLATLRTRSTPVLPASAMFAALFGSSGGAGAADRGGAGAPAGAGAAVGGGESGPVVAIWLHDSAGAPARRTSHDAQTESSLRALGYIQ